MSVSWEPGVLGSWLHMVFDDHVTGYLIDFRNGKVTVEYNTSKGYKKVATFDTEEEARAYAEVCYRIGVHE